jgi:hypothetical protein
MKKLSEGREILWEKRNELKNLEQKHPNLFRNQYLTGLR